MWAHFAMGASFQAPSVVLPLIKDEYGIGHTTAGLLVGAVMVIFGVFGIPGGSIVGRFGANRIFPVCWFMMGTLTLAALSPDFYGLLALRIAFALGAVLIVLATAPLVMHWFRPRELPIITSLNMAALSLGIAVSTSTMAPLAEILDWQKVMGIFGAIGLVGAFAWLVWGQVRGEISGVATNVKWREIRGVLRTRTVLVLGFADAACFSQYIALAACLPSFYNETRGMSLTETGLITSMLPIAGIFAVLLSGFLTLKIHSRRIFFVVPGVMVGLGGLGSFLIEEPAVLYAAVMLVGLGSWLYSPVIMTLPMELPGMTPQKVAIVWGWIMTTSGVGAFISPLVVGAFRDNTGSFIPGFLVFSALSWFLVIAGFLLPTTTPVSSSLESPAPTVPSPD